MTTLTTATVGQKVRVRVRRSWVLATVLTVGTDYGGTPTASVDIPDRWGPYRNVAISKLRSA
jgi:hypothetical protein